MASRSRDRSYYGGSWHGGQTGKGTIQVRIEVSPSPAELASKYGAASQDFKDYTPAWRRLIPRLRTALQANFDAKGTPLGAEWAPLDAKYARRKSREAPGAPPLWLTGKMLGGIGALNVRPLFMRYGVKAPQARALNFGFLKPMTMGTRQGQLGARRWAKAQGLSVTTTIPGRPFIGVTAEIEEAAIEEIDRHVAWLLSKLEVSGSTFEASAA